MRASRPVGRVNRDVQNRLHACCVGGRVCVRGGERRVSLPHAALTAIASFTFSGIIPIAAIADAFGATVVSAIVALGVSAIAASGQLSMLERMWAWYVRRRVDVAVPPASDTGVLM